ncbi:MAG: glyoxalase superfamily protein [Candidatus Devosia symbiotica]|nr:glyoxalase superfamily protein [Candidatus Devosia symbiotica]
MTHSAALKQVACTHGYRDWNTAHVTLPDHVAIPFQVSSRVTSSYLEQPFTGVLIGVQMLGDGGHSKITVTFDEPVNVTPDFIFAALRHRVVATIDSHGVTSALRGNGQPQMVVRRA